MNWGRVGVDTVSDVSKGKNSDDNGKHNSSLWQVQGGFEQVTAEI